MRTLVFLMLALIASPAYSQITIGRYRVNGTIEFNADLQIEEVVPMTTIPDPIAGWNFSDETAAFGSFDDLDNINSVAFSTGKIGDAANFVAASSQQLTVPGGPGDMAIAGSFTMQAWVKFTSLPNNATRHIAGSSDYRLYIVDGFLGTPKLRGQVVNTSNATIDTEWSTTPSTDAWIHVVFRVNVDANTADLFVNGTKVDTKAFASTPRTTAMTFSFGGIGTQYNDGSLDATYIWDTALSDAQIAALYNGGDGLELPIATNATSFIPTYGTPALALATYGTSAAPIATMGVSKQ